MTPEQEALVEALRVASPTDEYNQPPLSLLRYIPSVRAVILALAAERDLLKLRCEWQEARAARSEFELEDPETTSVISEMSIKEEAARAAYVAAGGTP